jgi:hypothetical protein
MMVVRTDWPVFVLKAVGVFKVVVQKNWGGKIVGGN